MIDAANAYSHKDFADLDDDNDIVNAIENARPVPAESPMPLYRALATSPDYPLDALGPILGQAARAIANQAQCATACAANAVLAVASLAAQGRADAILPIGQGKRTPLSLYIMTVLESGERKSTADSFALKPVRDFERELADAEAGLKQIWQVKSAAHDTAAKALHTRLKSDRSALEAALHELGATPMPPMLSIIAPGGDQTFEGLFKVYQNGRPSLAMLCDDGATFLGGHSLKAENKAGTVANLCRAWDGSRLERIRSLDGATVLYDRRLACHIMIQPGVAGDFLSDRQFADQGLLARFLLSAPSAVSLAGRLRNEDATAERNETAEAACNLAPYNDAIGRFLRAEPRWKNESDRSAGVELDSLPLNLKARALYIQFHNATMTQMAPGGTLQPIKPFAAKLAENAVRMAGVLTLMADSGATEIAEVTLADAFTLAEYYADEALRLSDAANIAPELKRADAVLKWLQDRKALIVGLTTIYQKGPYAIRSAANARTAMQILEAHGHAHLIPDGADIDGNRHREAWRINLGGSHGRA